MEKSSKLLRVASILMIIFAILGAILVVIAAVATGVLAGFDSTGAIIAMVIVGLIIGVIGSIIQLIAGIIGVKNFDKPEKAQKCIVFGIIVVVLALVDVVLSVVGSGQFGVAQVSSIIFGMAIPVLYLIGAFQLKKSA